jgi:hypothetical protein
MTRKTGEFDYFGGSFLLGGEDSHGLRRDGIKATRHPHDGCLACLVRVKEAVAFSLPLGQACRNPGKRV